MSEVSFSALTMLVGYQDLPDLQKNCVVICKGSLPEQV